MRHAHAGDRAKWRGRDDLRPLSAIGLRQSAWLIERLDDERLGDVVSSPAIRCVETVEALAYWHHRAVRRDSRLAEGRGPRAALALLRNGRGAVVCTHGDVGEEALGVLEEDGVRLSGGLRFAKGSVWVFEHDRAGRIRRGRYLAPRD